MINATLVAFIDICVMWSLFPSGLHFHLDACILSFYPPFPSSWLAVRHVASCYYWPCCCCCPRGWTHAWLATTFLQPCWKTSGSSRSLDVTASVTGRQHTTGDGSALRGKKHWGREGTPQRTNIATKWFLRLTGLFKRSGLSGESASRGRRGWLSGATGWVWTGPTLG